MPTSKTFLGYVAYEGPSALDGATPIVVVVTGFGGSTNRKTGGMLQSYILLRDVPPVVGLREGLDGPICGDCPRRSKASGGDGACYVNVGHGPRAVWDAYQRGRYPVLAGGEGLDAIRTSGKGFRAGTYGDPAAVPHAALFWGPMFRAAAFHTGYTHSWHRREGAQLVGLVMASCDSVQEGVDARRQGWASFRVSAAGDRHRLPGEAQCPASEEAKRRVTCETCPLKCDGAGAKVAGIAIQAHGSKKGRVK